VAGARELVRETLMHTVTDDQQLEEELHVLANSLSRRQPGAAQRV